MSLKFKEWMTILVMGGSIASLIVMAIYAINIENTRRRQCQKFCKPYASEIIDKECYCHQDDNTLIKHGETDEK